MAGAEPIGPWLKAAVQHNAGRVVAVALGTLLAVAAIYKLSGFNQIGAIALGAGIAGTGALVRYFKEASFSPDGVKVLTRDLDEGAAASRMAEEPPDVPVESSTDALLESIESDDTSAPSPTEADDDIVGFLNWSMATLAFQALIEWLRSDPHIGEAAIRLYLLDDRGMLVPSLPDGDNVSTEWRPGVGATGMAWQRGEYVAASGEAVWDSTFGLPEGSRDRFGHLTAVGSTPVFNRAGTVIGVLTASTAEPEPELVTPGGREVLMTGALLASRILVELLQWFDDDR